MENKTEQTGETQSENKKGINIPKILKSKTVRNIIFVLVAIGLIGGGYLIYKDGRQIYNDKAEISAPNIILSSEQPGILRELLVKNGDRVFTQEVVAKLDNGFVRAKTDGIIVDTDNEIGKFFSPGMSVITMINPSDLRVVAHIAENKGLSSIKVGQKVMFTVDAFGSKQINQPSQFLSDIPKNLLKWV